MNNGDDNIDSELVREAYEWLIERFRMRREWDSPDLFRAAKEANISKAAIYAAKELLELPKARKEDRQVWVWWVPENWPQLDASY